MPKLRKIERSRRDWIVDVAFVAIALLLGLVFRGTTEEQLVGDPPQFFWDLDSIVGPLFCLALLLRRRWPMGLAIASIPITAFSTLGAVAASLVLFTVAIHRPARYAFAVGAGQIAAQVGFVSLYPQRDTPDWLAFAFGVVVTGAVVAWGMYVRARRQLLASLRERAERAESEQKAMADRAREAERSRIAREMHDVLAHRVTLISLHAGALELKPDQEPEEIERSAALIRKTARLAMTDLRGVIGLLRGAQNGGAPAGPQPTLSDVPRLVDESLRAGARVELLVDVPDVAATPPALGRDAYRIVQEALTNVNKHARGTATSVSVRGAPGAGLTVEVRNRLPVGHAVGPAVPGSGSGLLGLAERVALSAGTIEHGELEDGYFVVRARLRWPSE